MDNSNLKPQTSNLLLAASVLAGLVALLWPLWGGGVDALVVFMVVGGLTLLVGLFAVQGGELDSKGLALLALLTALNASLRLLPSFEGGSPIFFLLIVGGFVFGAGFGYMFGALTLFVSAIITGGAGPWLPYQMMVAAWVGMSAGLLGVWWRGRGEEARGGLVVGLLAGFGAIWGLLYGLFLNLWFWAPTVSGAAGVELLPSYLSFYLVTSFGYDLWRSALNVILVVTLGGATLRVLYRFRRRFYFRAYETKEQR